MALPPQLLSLTRTRRFWTDFYQVTEEDHNEDFEDSIRIELEVAPGYSLTLTLDDTSWFYLKFSVPDRGEIDLGWIDGAHPFPHALRWSELNAICRAIALRKPALPHPGVPLLLLCQFAPICVDDDVDFIVSLLYSAWARLDLFTATEIRTFIEWIDLRDAGFLWILDEKIHSWTLTQRDPECSWYEVYSLRDVENEDFPFGSMREFLTAVNEVVAGTEESVIGRAVSTHNPIEIRARHWLEVELPLKDNERPLGSSGAKVFRDSFDVMLRDLAIGRADVGSSHWGVKDSISIILRGDLDYGSGVIAQQLLWGGAPTSTAIHRYGERENLFKAEGQSTGAEIYLQFGSAETYTWESFDGEVCYRLDKIPLTQENRRVLRGTLASVGASEPDEDGWFRSEMPDGGSLSICLGRLHDDLERSGGTIVIHELSQGVAELVHRILSDGGLVLLPMAVCASESQASAIRQCCPNAKVVDPDQLLDILQRGPYLWWKATSQRNSLPVR